MAVCRNNQKISPTTKPQKFKNSNYPPCTSEVKVEKEKKLRVVSCLVHKNGWTAFENGRESNKLEVNLSSKSFFISLFFPPFLQASEVAQEFRKENEIKFKSSHIEVNYVFVYPTFFSSLALLEE